MKYLLVLLLFMLSASCFDSDLYFIQHHKYKSSQPIRRYVNTDIDNNKLIKKNENNTNIRNKNNASIEDENEKLRKQRNTLNIEDDKHNSAKNRLSTPHNYSSGSGFRFRRR